MQSPFFNGDNSSEKKTHIKIKFLTVLIIGNRTNNKSLKNKRNVSRILVEKKTKAIVFREKYN